jgi:hypothetical protein
MAILICLGSAIECGNSCMVEEHWRYLAMLLKSPLLA